MNSQWKLVPVEPTETMVINGFESEPNECFTDEAVWEQYQEMSGCQQAAFRAKLCWAAMLAAAPASPEEDAQPVMKLEAEKLLGGHGEYAMSFVRAGWLDECRASGGEFMLYTRPDAGKVAQLTAEREALQLRLNAADQRIDDFAGGDCEWSQDGESGIWNSACGSTWSFHDDGPEENGMNFCHSCGKHLVVEVDGPELDDDWHMNPCKQGHRDVGAAGGVAACNQCDEKIEAATTQEAFERWNATHPAEQPAPAAVAPDFKMIGTEPMPPMEYDEP